MQPKTHCIGLVVNPLAGIGGEVGLVGSDGERIQAQAAARGGRARAPERATRFGKELERIAPGAQIVSWTGALGGSWVPGVTAIGETGSNRTTAEDTRKLAGDLATYGVELIVFVGGDGTARDVLGAIPEGQLCIGVPAGVKMHSGVFAVTPEDAAAQAVEVLSGRGQSAVRDVVDLDENARREGLLVTTVYGTMRVPRHERMQRGKRSPASGHVDVTGIAEEVRRGFGHGKLVFGPGTTVASIERQFGITPSLLGFDVLEADGTVHLDVTGMEAERILGVGEEDSGSGDFAVVLSPVGGQGFVIGRGNHQLTERILDKLEPCNLVLIAEPAKLGELAGKLRIDAPTRELNDKFRGNCRVFLGADDIAIGRIE